MSAINREAAIDKFKPWLKVEGYSEGERNILKAVLFELQEFPSVEPERKTGQWLEMHCRNNYFGDLQICKCSECGRYDARPYLYYFSRPNFCSWCGTEMKGEAE